MAEERKTEDSRSRSLVVLIASTAAFALCFACWVLNAVLVVSLVQQGTFAFDETQVGGLLAVPILTGSITRVPLGVLTDRYGGRAVFVGVMLASAVPLYALSQVHGFYGFLLASLGFGLAGGSFAVGVAYVSLWFDKKRQGVALGVFGLGNVGAAATTALVPSLLAWATQNGSAPEGWRLVPKLGAASLVLGAALFFAVTRSRKPAGVAAKSMAERLAPLRDATVWRFGLYYFLVFGAFVTLAQWLIPYGVSVYDLPVARAGRIATYFSLPASLVSIVGGLIADRFGARLVMTWVFRGCLVVCALLSIPRMDVRSPGEGVLARRAGEVTRVEPGAVTVGQRVYPLREDAREEAATSLLPHATSYQEPVVTVGAHVVKNQLLARGVTRVRYPANLDTFVALVVLLGMLFGIGKASVLKFIPEQFPQSIGAVSGVVGLVGALSGFFFPILFGYLLRWTGIWTTCWVVLTALSIVCLSSVQLMAARILREEAPDLARLIERRPSVILTRPSGTPVRGKMEDILRSVSFFANLTDDERKRIAEAGSLRMGAPGEILFDEGSADTALYVVLEGSVRIHRSGSDGQDVHLRDVAAGEYFGEMSLLDGAPRAASATVASPVEMFVLERRDLLVLLSRSPHMVTDLLVGLSGHIRTAVDRIAGGPLRPPTAVS